MVGGFLGAGKTTTLIRLGQHLNSSGKTVGLITNDQADNLVDTLNLRSQGFSVEEVAGACICRRFPSLIEAAEKLVANDGADVFLGEPIGSCTDIIGTVFIPMQGLHGDCFEVAPLTVLIDPSRARKVLAGEQRGGFTPKVAYIYHKQLEEADAIAVNKIDLLDEAAREEVLELVADRYPGKRLFAFSSATGEGLGSWIDYITTENKDQMQAVALDDQTRTDGVAELGWLNATCRLSAGSPFDPNRFLTSLAGQLADLVSAQGGQIAHLKMAIISGLDVGLLSVVDNNEVPELSRLIRNQLTEAELTINARAQTAPEVLSRASVAALADACTGQRITHEILSIQAFRPERT